MSSLPIPASPVAFLHRESAPSLQPGAGAVSDPALRAAAQRFEAVFWSEMLRHAGLARPPEGFGGGAGEANFAPMLVREYADLLAREGRAGIAGHVYAALRERNGG